MFKHLGICCLAAMICLSCSKQVDDEPQAPEVEQSSKVYQIPYDKALERAIEAVTSLGGSATKSRSLKVKDHVVYKVERSVVTRSELPSDSLFYVFNFEDNGGFAIVPSDPNSGGVLAMADNGNFDVNSTEPGFDVLMESMTNYQMRSVLGDNPNDPGNGGIGNGGGGLPDPNLPGGGVIGDYGPGTTPPEWDPHSPTYRKYGPLETYAKKGPMIPHLRWHQQSPWNGKIPDQIAAGCVTIATAQIMSYFRHPASWNGITYDWDAIQRGDTCASAIQLISDVLHNLPNRSIYGEGNQKGYSIPDRSVVYCLDKLGYSDDGQEVGYNFNNLRNSINGNSPVYAGAFSEASHPIWDPEYWFNPHGHAWVMDGYITQGRTFQDSKVPNFDLGVIATGTEYYHYVHCKWGWSPRLGKDGYYKKDIFDASNGPVDKESTDPDNPSNGASGFYRYNFKIRVNIKK